MADQICYSVLCVFSYVAAGQDQSQKKNPVVITPQIQDIHAQQKQQHAQQQQQQGAAPRTAHLPSQQQNTNKQQTITIRHTQPMQKPTMTTSTVQPQSRLVHTNAKTHTTATTTIAAARAPLQQQQPSTGSQQLPQQKSPIQPSKGHPALGMRKSSGSAQSSPLPQLPPRLPSQTSTESLATSPTPSTGSAGRRGPPPGPPPAIPPRTGAIARSGSVQQSTMASARQFVRQISANSTPPQYTPQPPPPFVIPKRHSSMQRAASMAAPHPTVASTAALFTTCSTAATASASASSSAHFTSTSTSPSCLPSAHNQQKRASYGSVSLTASLSSSPSSNAGSSSTSPQAPRKH